MPNTITGAEAYARTHYYRDNGSWAGWCASFCYRAGGFSQSFKSAMVAGDNAGPLRTDWWNAPRGAIHYWAGVGGFGHCAFDLGGSVLLMASASVTVRWGKDMGTINFAEYARKGIPYRGWSMRWGSQTLAPDSSTAGGGGAIIDNTDQVKEEDDIMKPDSMFAYVDNVPSWCWINWATGNVYACHTQKDANWIAGYMGPIRDNWGAEGAAGGEKYKSKLAMLGILGPDEITITMPQGADDIDYERIEALIYAGADRVLKGMNLS